MKLFKSTTSGEDVLVLVNFNQDDADLGIRLWKWLERRHNEIYWDIVIHERGSLSISKDKIVFSGDNRIFTLESVKATKV